MIGLRFLHQYFIHLEKFAEWIVTDSVIQTQNHVKTLKKTIKAFSSTRAPCLTALLSLLQDTNLKGRFGRTLMIQRSCVPLSLVYRPAFIPGCPQDANSQLYYPAAQCCRCRRCNSSAYHCVQPRPLSYGQCSITPGSVENQNRTCFGNMTRC